MRFFMEFNDFNKLFCEAIEKNGLQAPEIDSVSRFHSFTEHLLDVNKTTNLTAIREIPDFIYKHLIDSLTVSAYVPQGATLLDLGCGPGFPSIPLAIARPDLTITALDSTAKKIAFVQNAAARLNLTNLTANSGRAEDKTLSKKLGKFDVVTGRAVARLNIFCELCLPYVRIGGKFVAMKGAKGSEELAEAANAIKTLGGSNAREHMIDLILADCTAEQRSIIEVEKASHSPASYPRAYASILKKPL